MGGRGRICRTLPLSHDYAASSDGFCVPPNVSSHHGYATSTVSGIKPLCPDCNKCIQLPKELHTSMTSHPHRPHFVSKCRWVINQIFMIYSQWFYFINVAIYNNILWTFHVAIIDHAIRLDEFYSLMWISSSCPFQ